MQLNEISIFVTSFLIVFVSTPVVRKYALRWKLGDKPNGRKVHTNLIPHLGGASLVLGTLGGLLLFSILSRSGSLEGNPPVLWRIAPGIVPIILLGLVDDTRSLKVFHKLLVQIIAGFLLVTAGFRLFVGIPLIDQVGLLSILLTVVYFVGISSAVNLVDGHDGLAGGICFIASAAFAVISSMAGAHANVAMSVALGAACLAFLVYNLPPGKIFMGDTGSMFLGVTLGIVACSLTMFQPSVGTFFGVCLVLGVPILDTWLAIARRCALHKPIFKADALHMHHVLSSFGFSPKQTLSILYSVEFVLAVLGILATRGFVLPIVIGCGFFIFVFVSFFRLMMAEGQREREAAAVLTEDSIPSLQSRAIASKSSR